MNFSEEETKLDQILGEADVDEPNLSPESTGGVKSSNADVCSNSDTERKAPREGSDGELRNLGKP